MWVLQCVGVVQGVVCVVWHAEKNPGVDSKTPPCVHSKRLRRVASTHGDVLNVHTEEFWSLHTEA